MRKILIVEDERAIREFEVINLNRIGYETEEADSGEKALEIFERDPESFDIALLDVMLPGIDGMEVCRKLRARSPEMGIIMLTAKTMEIDKVNGLMQGADDYITKPFSPAELNARVDALYRKVEALKQKGGRPDGERVVSGEFELDTRRRTLKKNGKTIDLTQIEYQIAEYFFSNPETTLTRDDILKRVWGEMFYGDDKIVDVNIRRLRIKIEDDPSNPKHLVTVWGSGYRWVEG